MNKEQAQKQIKELKAKVEELEDTINHRDRQLAYQRKKIGTTYFYVGATAESFITYENGDNTDSKRFNCGNYKQTREQAERHAERRRTLDRLLCIADELNEGWEPNWDDSEEYKWHIHYDHRYSLSFRVNSNRSCSENKVYFKTEEMAEEAISRLDGRDKAVFRGEV